MTMKRSSSDKTRTVCLRCGYLYDPACFVASGVCDTGSTAEVEGVGRREYSKEYKRITVGPLEWTPLFKVQF
jgi:hypothetical protein